MTTGQPAEHSARLRELSSGDHLMRGDLPSMRAGAAALDEVATLRAERDYFKTLAERLATEQAQRVVAEQDATLRARVQQLGALESLVREWASAWRAHYADPTLTTVHALTEAEGNLLANPVPETTNTRGPGDQCLVCQEGLLFLVCSRCHAKYAAPLPVPDRP